AQYLVDSIHRADEEHAALLVLEIDTPGGLVDPTKEIIQAMNAAKTPIAVFVAPSAARAASAGFFVLISADVAAMAPATNTGAAPESADRPAPPRPRRHGPVRRNLAPRHDPPGRRRRPVPAPRRARVPVPADQYDRHPAPRARPWALRPRAQGHVLRRVDASRF